MPNNYVTAKIVGTVCLMGQEEQFQKRIVVIPTLGSEYYYIKSLLDKGLELDSDILNTYINLKYYKDSDWIEKKKFAYRNYSTYEKFGKRIIEHNFYSCISNPIENIADYNKYGLYMLKIT